MVPETTSPKLKVAESRFLFVTELGSDRVTAERNSAQAIPLQTNTDWQFEISLPSSASHGTLFKTCCRRIDPGLFWALEPVRRNRRFSGGKRFVGSLYFPGRNPGSDESDRFSAHPRSQITEKVRLRGFRRLSLSSRYKLLNIDGMTKKWDRQIPDRGRLFFMTVTVLPMDRSAAAYYFKLSAEIFRQ
jgi:hypothetical protein